MATRDSRWPPHRFNIGLKQHRVMQFVWLNNSFVSMTRYYLIDRKSINNSSQISSVCNHYFIPEFELASMDSGLP